jgi:Flp pilus assembly protein TadG
MRARRQRGATTVEMTLVGIPIIFILISVFEISRGMWMYHTLSYSVRNGVRTAVVHGINCINHLDVPNNCPKTINDIATAIQQSAVGIDPGLAELTFTPGSAGAGSTSCYLATPVGTPPYGALSNCSTYSTLPWPPDDGNGTYNGVGKTVRIDIRTPFASALGMFWPGSKPVNFALMNLGATSTDYVQF